MPYHSIISVLPGPHLLGPKGTVTPGPCHRSPERPVCKNARSSATAEIARDAYDVDFRVDEPWNGYSRLLKVIRCCANLWLPISTQK